MNFTDIFANLWKSTGIFNMILPADPNLSGAEQIMHMYGAPIMFLVCLVLLYLGIKKNLNLFCLYRLHSAVSLQTFPCATLQAPKAFWE